MSRRCSGKGLQETVNEIFNALINLFLKLLIFVPALFLKIFFVFDRSKILISRSYHFPQNINNIFYQKIASP